MSRITTALTAGFSMMLPVTSPVLLGLTSAVGIGAEVLATQTAHAQSAEDWYNSGMLSWKQFQCNCRLEQSDEIYPQYAFV